jgi:hypothetical protein
MIAKKKYEIISQIKFWSLKVKILSLLFFKKFTSRKESAP